MSLNLSIKKYLMVFVLAYTSFSLAKAEKLSKEDWLTWKDKTYKKALESPTSFLNASSVANILPGKKLFLVKEQDGQYRWVKTLAKGQVSLGQIDHLGEKSTVAIKDPVGKSEAIKGHKENWRVVLPVGKSHKISVQVSEKTNKAWAYVFDLNQIKRFTGFRFYPFNKKAIVSGKLSLVEPYDFGYKSYQNEPRTVRVIGEVEFEWEGKVHKLRAYNWQKPEEKIDYAAFVFTDDTENKETYGGGRELVIDIDGISKKISDVNLDFNRTTNFWCAHTPLWHCPVGLQQKIFGSLLAGEMLPVEKIIK